MAYQAEIAAAISKALGDVEQAPDVTEIEQWVEVPKDKANGDFAFPCFRLAKTLRKNPAQIAAELLPTLQTAVSASKDLSQVAAAGPFLNFHVDKAALAADVVPAILDGSFLATRASQEQRVMIEYSQPNTHKAFHVGHTRNVALGHALVCLFEWCGYDVVAANYIGDEGTHIAKCLWYFQTYFDGEVPDTNRGEFLGELYARASELMDFKTLTQVPMPKVVTAKVTAKDALPGHDKLNVVQVSDGNETFQVICGGTGYDVGDVVPYARVGSRVAGRRVGAIEKHGVPSTGMICSEKEIGLSDDHMQIYLFPVDTDLGLELAEYFRVDGALPADRSVLAEMKAREQGVADVLKGLEAKEPAITKLWEETKAWSMAAFHEIYAWLDVRFDHYFFESDVGDTGKQICLDYYNKGVLVESEGAIGADLTDENLPFLLLIKSNGAGLYATKDIALAQEKFEKFHVDRSIYVVDASQSLHFQQVFKTLEKMGYKRAAHCYHLAYGLVVLPSGKMGSRRGNVILFSQLQALLDEKIRSEYLDKYQGEWPDAEIEAAARRIAVATIKYGMVNQDNLKVIVFDLEEWAGRTGNTGPYMLYAYARTRSILRELGAVDTSLTDWSLLDHEAEQTLLTTMSKFHEVVAGACRDYRPQAICIYLFQLTKDFNRMYDKCSVKHADTEALKATRAQLVDAAGRLIQQGLALLGIQTIDRM